MNSFERRYGNGFGKGRKSRVNPGLLFRILKYTGAALLACVLILLISGLFRVKTVEINGANVYSNELIASVGGVDVGDTYTKVGKNAVEARIRSGLPFVKNVSVAKKPFFKVVIDVEEYPQIYYLQSGNVFFGVTDGLEILTKSSEEDDFARLGGATVIIPECTVGDGIIFTLTEEEAPERKKTMSDTEYAEAYKRAGDEKNAYVAEVLKALSGSDYAGNITKVSLREKYNISFIINNKIKVILGGPQELADKLKKTGMIYGQLKDTEMPAAVIDVSNPSRPVWGEKTTLDYGYETEEETAIYEETVPGEGPDEHGAYG